jgi:hypothetical protein
VAQIDHLLMNRLLELYVLDGATRRHIVAESAPP